MASILIIDDSPTCSQIIAKIVQQRGHSVSFARDGESGIKKVRAKKPDLVLMDLIMPGMNGFQAMRKLNHDPETSDIPVIIVSSKDQEADIVYGQRQGAVEYIVKPFDKAMMFAKIDKALSC